MLLNNRKRARDDENDVLELTHEHKVRIATTNYNNLH